MGVREKWVNPDTYHMCDNLNTEYCHLDCYLCTLTSDCITDYEIDTTAICGFRPSIITLHKQFRLTDECVQHISWLQETSSSVNAESITTEVSHNCIIMIIHSLCIHARTYTCTCLN